MRRATRWVALVLVALVTAAAVGWANLDPAVWRDLLVDLASRASGRPVSVDGPWRLALSPTPRLHVAGVHFAAVDEHPQSVRVQDLVAEIALRPLLSGVIEVRFVLLRGVVVELRPGGPAGSAASNPVPAGPPMAAERLVLALRRVRVEDLRVSLPGGGGVALGAVDARMSADDATMQFVASGGSGARKFSFSGTLAGVAEVLGGGGDTISVTTEGDGFGAHLSASGNLRDLRQRPWSRLDLRLATARPARLRRALAEVLPADLAGWLEPGALSLAARVTATAARTEIDVRELRLGASDVAGYVRLEEQRVEARLRSRRLVVATGSGPPGGLIRATGDGRWRFAEQGLPLPPGFPLKLRWDVERLSTAYGDLRAVALDARLRGRHIELAPLEFELDGGRVTMRADYQATARPPAATLRLRARGLDLGRLLDRVDAAGSVRGEADIDVDLVARGESPQALAASLGGSVRASTREGMIDSAAFDVLTSDVFDALNDRDDRRIECAVADFRIDAGRARAHALVVRTGGLTAIGSGDVRITDGALALVVEPRARKSSLSTTALAPIEIGGGLLAPRWRVDGSAIAGNVAAGAARTYGALATGGLSLLVEKVVTELVRSGDRPDLCARALAGKAVVRQPSRPPVHQASAATRAAASAALSRAGER